jgi:hypothetical protein
MQKVIWQCRTAPSLGSLESTPEKIWGTIPYKSKDEPTVFMGLYGLKDFYELWTHKGRKAIFWCGSDIRHFDGGYWLDDKGYIRIQPWALAKWISTNCENYVENQVEAAKLRDWGIEPVIVPSFLGDVDSYRVSYKYAKRPQVYASVSGDDFHLYGWYDIERIAGECDVDFHLYGNTVPWETRHPNVFIHGRVPKEQMNAEIKNMQCGLRVVGFDGFSEILAKSVLWGQYPISRIKYPHITSYEDEKSLIGALNDLKNKRRPNLKARSYYKKVLNKYPWNIYV